jgi:hypothetical protein
MAGGVNFSIDGAASTESIICYSLFSAGVGMTVDEELSKLEESIRRLKVEYEAYFNGGAPRAPSDSVFRVETTIKRYSDNSVKLNFGQRFRFNQLTQKYAVYRDLWRKKLKDKEEGRGRFGQQVREPVKAESGARVVCSDPEKEQDKVDQLLKAMIEAKRQTGERVDNIDPLSFSRFVQQKTRQLKESLGCDKVQFSIDVEDGRVKFRAVKAD